MNKEKIKEISLRALIIAGLMLITCVLDMQAQTLEKVTQFTYNRKMAVNVPALAQISEEVSQFLSTVHKSAYVQVDEGKIFKRLNISLEDVQQTAEFIAKTAREHPSWLNTPWFYREFFDIYRLYSDGPLCPAKMGKLPRGWPGAPSAHRITTYRVCKIPGSRIKTSVYNFPLYSRPFDEAHKGPRQHTAKKEPLTRFVYTRQEIVGGSLEPGKAQVIAWVTLEGYKELVMQGSAMIDFDDGSPLQTFQVVVHNGKEGSEKYWFIAPYEKKRSKKFPVKVDPVPGVSFAGNIAELGFGKVLLMIGKNPLDADKEKEMMVGMLVDTGDAFQDNLCKFDLFTGYFEDHHLFKKHTRHYPHTAEIYIIIKKKKKSQRAK